MSMYVMYVNSINIYDGGGSPPELLAKAAAACRLDSDSDTYKTCVQGELNEFIRNPFVRFTLDPEESP